MSNLTPGIESLDFRFTGQRQAGRFEPVLVGVVGSGNLEVMLEPASGIECTIHMDTDFASAQAALADKMAFLKKHLGVTDRP